MRSNVDAAGLDPQPEQDRVPVEAQFGRRLDNLDAVKFGFGQHVFAWAARPVKEELPEGPGRHRDQCDDVSPAREPHIRQRLETLDI
jgi:hypothetical protein